MEENNRDTDVADEANPAPNAENAVVQGFLSYLAALETSPLVNTPLRDLDLPDGVRIGAIYREATVVMPDGDTIIKAHDRIIIFATADQVRQVEQMFRVSLEFF